jgi:hypothetical protein
MTRAVGACGPGKSIATHASRSVIQPCCIMHLNLHPQLHLTNDELLLVIIELVLWDLQVERSGTSSNSSRDIVMGTVTRAEPSSVITSLSDRYTTQVGADLLASCSKTMAMITHQTPNMTSHSPLWTRSSSLWGSRRVLGSTCRASLISSSVRCRMNTGFPRHLTIKFLPTHQRSFT